MGVASQIAGGAAEIKRAEFSNEIFSGHELIAHDAAVDAIAAQIMQALHNRIPAVRSRRGLWDVLRRTWNACCKHGDMNAISSKLMGSLLVAFAAAAACGGSGNELHPITTTAAPAPASSASATPAKAASPAVPANEACRPGGQCVGGGTCTCRPGLGGGQICQCQ